MEYELIVIGGGPAGLAAALQAYESGLRRILVVERDLELGGILNQCIHNGFGLHYFKEELTGPEYAERFIQPLAETTIEVKLDTMVLQLSAQREVHAVNKIDGYMILRAKSIILAMGCRERNRGPIGLAGDRGSGVFSAGTAQRYLNMEGYMVGKRAVILGSGDIGLIMARRMTLEGAKVEAVVEIMPHPGGLNRNIVQCLQDFDIPLYLSHTITEVTGRRRVEKVVVAKVDENRRPVPGTSFEIPCDTLLLSVGLIPENELSKSAGVAIDPRTGGAMVNEEMQTSVPGIFACGNVLHVHDLVDFVTKEAQKAGRAAAAYLQGKTEGGKTVSVRNGTDVTYTVPQKIGADMQEKFTEVFFRVRRILYDAQIVLRSGDAVIASYKREYMAPGEMEKIAVPRQFLDRCENGMLEVSVQAKDEAHV